MLFTFVYGRFHFSPYVYLLLLLTVQFFFIDTKSNTAEMLLRNTMITYLAIENVSSIISYSSAMEGHHNSSSSSLEMTTILGNVTDQQQQRSTAISQLSPKGREAFDYINFVLGIASLTHIIILIGLWLLSRFDALICWLKSAQQTRLN